MRGLLKKPMVTLLTDFGLKDHYVASMKGVILGINPQCLIIDITHQVKPHDIEEAAFILVNVYSFFPKGTIHLAVVDPGVGGERKPILLVTEEYYFIGPDNGLFTLVAQREKIKQIIVLKEEKYFLSKVSHTFHGRDLFAPVAAHLSLGINPDAFGNRIDSLNEFRFERPMIRGGRLSGRILHVDAFGNLISNITEEIFFQYVQDRPFIIQIGRETIHGLKKGYWEGKKGERMALFGSGGFLEISMREGSAQNRLKVNKNDRIWISVNSKDQI